MLDLIIMPVKYWYLLLLIIFILDKIVAITPMPWDDVILTSLKFVRDKISNAVNSFIASIVIKPIEVLFSGEKDICCGGKENCCH